MAPFSAFAAVFCGFVTLAVLAHWHRTGRGAALFLFFVSAVLTALVVATGIA